MNGKSDDELEDDELAAIDLSIVGMKEISAEWIFDMAEYIRLNPSIPVNGFITYGALEGISLLASDSEELPHVPDQDDSSADESVFHLHCYYRISGMMAGARSTTCLKGRCVTNIPR
uniref:Uncharacterized protein n=1 Tax=Amphimedon queenslandica TaxID=400682 RepID=A0A1X7UP73_AMPQE